MFSSIRLLLSRKSHWHYFKNTFWLLAEKALRLIAGLAVGVWLARYLGSAQYGILSYALSMSAIFANMMHLGLSGLVVRELVRIPDKTGEILGTVFFLKLLVSLFAIAIFAGLVWYSEPVGSQSFYALLIAAMGILFQPFQVIDFWFEAHVLGRAAALSKAWAMLLVVVLKILLIAIGAGLLMFVASSVLESALLGLFFIIAYRSKSSKPLPDWRFEFGRAKQLLRQSWPVMLGSFFAIIYLKIDQVMLKWISGVEQVGVYAVAAQLSEVWYVLPVSIVSSLYPKLIQLRGENHCAYQIKLQQIFDLLAGLGIVVAVLTTVFSQSVISLLYGDAYRGAAGVLSIHIWAGVFIFMRALLSKWILMEDVLQFSLITQGAGAMVNVLLNGWLIPAHGVYGAAIATLIAYAFASFGVLVFYKKTRPVFWMMTKSLFVPLRLLSVLKK